METIRHLKDLGIEVRFEKENINSLSSDGEFLLTLLASFAQEEIYSLSENTKWGLRRRFQNGEIGMANKRILGYQYDEEKRCYVIIPEEADIVRRMFQMYIEGISLRNIAKALNDAGYKTVTGNKFYEASIRLLIQNEIYVGDIRRQKTFVEDPVKKRKVKNCGQLPQYYMQDCHESIIDCDTYQKLLAETERRKSLLNPEYCFTRKIYCGVCGHVFTRKKSLIRGKTYVDWICRAKKEKGVTCSSPNFKEDDLKKICTEMLEIETFDEVIFENNIKKITVQQNGSLEFTFKDGNVKMWQDNCRLLNRHIPTSTEVFKDKIFCGKCCASYHRINAANKWVYWYCMGKKLKDYHCDNKNYADYHLRNISAYMLGLDEFNAEVFEEKIDKITVLENGSLEYKFNDGRMRIWQRK